MTAEAAGTVAAALIASGTGVAAYLSNRRSRRNEEALRRTDKTAALAKAEVEGWKTLIDTLIAQYRTAMTDGTELRVALALALQQAEELKLELRVAKERIGVLEERVVELRTRVTKLGGDAAHAARLGRGPRGPKGPKGDTGKSS